MQCYRSSRFGLGVVQDARFGFTQGVGYMLGGPLAGIQHCVTAEVHADPWLVDRQILWGDLMRVAGDFQRADEKLRARFKILQGVRRQVLS